MTWLCFQIEKWNSKYGKAYSNQTRAMKGGIFVLKDASNRQKVPLLPIVYVNWA